MHCSCNIAAIIFKLSDVQPGEMHCTPVILIILYVCDLDP